MKSCFLRSISYDMQESPLETIKRALGKSHACYVLITCNESTEPGEMDVQMDFEGDEELAAYLVGNASQIFEERLALRESK